MHGVRSDTPFRLDGKAAVVTGASRGIGAATAQALDDAGAHVALVARSANDLEATAKKLSNDPVVIVGDVGAPGGPAQISRDLAATLGEVQILVNNAAVAARLPSEELTGELVDEVLATNVRGLLMLSTALLPSMVRRGGGSIVNLGSVSGVTGTPRRAAYAASKGAVDAMTRSLAMEYGPSGVRVNSVAPGVIVTDMWKRNRAIPGVIEQLESQIALRRWGNPEDVADVIVFLASDAARYVTAQTISVDGGMAHTLDLYGGGSSRGQD